MDAHIKALQRLRHYQLTLIELQLRSEAANDPARKTQLQAALAVLKNDIRQYEPTKHLLKTWRSEEHDKSRRWALFCVCVRGQHISVLCMQHTAYLSAFDGT